MSLRPEQVITMIYQLVQHFVSRRFHNRQMEKTPCGGTECFAGPRIGAPRKQQDSPGSGGIRGPDQTAEIPRILNSVADHDQAVGGSMEFFRLPRKRVADRQDPLGRSGRRKLSDHRFRSPNHLGVRDGRMGKQIREPFRVLIRFEKE